MALMGQNPSGILLNFPLLFALVDFCFFEGVRISVLSRLRLAIMRSQEVV